MLYRAAAILVTGFWLTMIGLLIRKEAGPGDSALREVPVGHVIKLLLMHEQASDLNISNGKMHLGNLRIHPQMHKGDRSRVIDFVGNLQIMVPGLERHRVDWSGEIELEKTLATRSFHLALTMRDPTQRNTVGYRAEITIVPAENQLTWTQQIGQSPPDEPHTYTLDDAGLQRALREIDPALLEMLQSQTRSMTPPVIKALQSSMLIHGERLDTYLVSIEQSGQTLLEFDVDQLGHILRAKTLIGYSLSPYDLVP